jgi:hypothetical protein
MRRSDWSWLLFLVVALLFGVTVGLMGGVTAERTYQCDKVGGQMVGSGTGSACIKGAEVVIRWN